ncbi:hypothetical protein PCANC_09596 [Puccinia coronata f. sp. avenae]|uniref:Uncharacterized protein n=1 Tax=Puccinia coronata f. sp. avenae TaxID=200324 RepID=A0A2N5VA25_9BASI|nr:hypothetical protein PCANC_09596 [Puccinia coronata f. sp. avenae]
MVLAGYPRGNAPNNSRFATRGSQDLRGRSARGLYLASILRAPEKLEILARYRISFQEILAKPKLYGVSGNGDRLTVSYPVSVPQLGEEEKRAGQARTAID